MDKVIVFENDIGGIAVFFPVPDVTATINELATQVVPAGVPYEIIDRAAVPTDGAFRNAWDLADRKVVVNLTKAKAIAHNVRRELRAKEFAPLDEIIAKQIPGNDYAAIEQQRQTVRDKYAVVQTNIDAATTPEQLKQILGL